MTVGSNTCVAKEAYELLNRLSGKVGRVQNFVLFCESNLVAGRSAVSADRGQSRAPNILIVIQPPQSDLGQKALLEAK